MVAYALELTASASDGSLRKLYEKLFDAYRREKRLIVPNAADWLLASKTLFSLTLNRKRYQRGRLKSLPAGASQRMALDVLIAVSASTVEGDRRYRELAGFQAHPAILQCDYRQGCGILPSLTSPRHGRHSITRR